MRVKGPDLFIMSLYGLHLPPAERAFHRWLHDKERFTLQGHSAENHEYMPSQRLARDATGNAFTVPLITSVVAPLVNRIAMGGSESARKGVWLTHEELLTLAGQRQLAQRASGLGMFDVLNAKNY